MYLLSLLPDSMDIAEYLDLPMVLRRLKPFDIVLIIVRSIQNLLLTGLFVSHAIVGGILSMHRVQLSFKHHHQHLMEIVQTLKLDWKPTESNDNTPEFGVGEKRQSVQAFVANTTIGADDDGVPVEQRVPVPESNVDPTETISSPTSPDIDAVEMQQPVIVHILEHQEQTHCQ